MPTSGHISNPREGAAWTIADHRALDKFLDDTGFEPLLPITRVIPPTPASSQTPKASLPLEKGRQYVSASAPAHDALARATPPSTESSSERQATPTISAPHPPGRLSGKKLDAMDICYNEVNDVFARSAEANGLSMAQLIAGWTRRNSTYTKLGNGWNIYSKYFVQNRVQELRRVLGDVPEEDLPSTSFIIHVAYDC
jgi:hypothetical protein